MCRPRREERKLSWRLGCPGGGKLMRLYSALTEDRLNCPLSGCNHRGRECTSHGQRNQFLFHVEYLEVETARSCLISVNLRQRQQITGRRGWPRPSTRGWRRSRDLALREVAALGAQATGSHRRCRRRHGWGTSAARRDRQTSWLQAVLQHVDDQQRPTVPVDT